MNYYETVYIIHPALQEGRLSDIVTKIHNKLEKLKGKMLYVDTWGKKKLAYPIDKQKYGTYIFCQYSLNGQNIKDISQELELNPNILRYLTTKIDEPDIKEGSNKLEINKKVKQENNRGNQKANKHDNKGSVLEEKQAIEKESLTKDEKAIEKESLPKDEKAIEKESLPKDEKTIEKEDTTNNT